MTEHESREALRCEKCGGTDVYTRYRAAGETLDDGFGTARSYFDKIKEECLRRVCRTCGWKWVDPIVAPVVGEREALVLTDRQFWMLEQMHNLPMGDEMYAVWKILWNHHAAARTPKDRG